MLGLLISQFILFFENTGQNCGLRRHESRMNSVTALLSSAVQLWLMSIKQSVSVTVT